MISLSKVSRLKLNWRLIRDNNCADLIPGYIFGAPMPASAFVELAEKLSRSKGKAKSLPAFARA
jgi:hypothetical protein